MKRFLPAAATAFLAVACFLAGSWARGRRPPAALASLPDFSMTAVRGATEEPFSRASLLGRPWVADFIFTRCGGPCPVLTGRMKGLSKRLPADFGLLTVSVDPAGDTPERIREYAGVHGADPRWVFLRGNAQETYRLLYAGFRLPLSTRPDAAPEARVLHSTRLVLIDKRGNIRGYYDGLSDRDIAALERDAARLMEERT